jgi:hypothetical protein
MIKENVLGSKYINVPADNILRRTFLAPNTSTSLQTTLAADAQLPEGQFLHEEQTLNKAKSLIYRAGTRRPTISKTKGQNFKPK